MKQFTTFKLREDVNLTADALHEALAEHIPKPILSYELQTVGFVPPCDSALVEKIGEKLVGCLFLEERKLPGPAIKKKVSDTIKRIEANEHRKPTRKERKQIKSDITQAIIPTLLTSEKEIRFYFDLKNRWLVINSAANKAIETVTETLRTALGSLPISPLDTKKAQNFLTTWALGNQLPEGVFINSKENVTFKNAESKGTVTADLLTEDIFMVTTIEKAGLYTEDVKVLIDNRLQISKFDIIDVNQMDSFDELEDKKALFTAEFFLYSRLYENFMNKILKAI